MWDFSHVEAATSVSLLPRERVCTEYWMFCSRREVFEEAHGLVFFLAASILLDPNWDYRKRSVIYWEEWSG